eukprot:362716-Chlamydomonas_euryale.AAC.9
MGPGERVPAHLPACLLTCQSVCPSSSLSAHLPVCLPICQSVCPSASLSAHPPACLPAPPASLPVRLLACLNTHPPASLPARLLTCQPVCPPACLADHLSTCLASACLAACLPSGLQAAGGQRQEGVSGWKTAAAALGTLPAVMGRGLFGDARQGRGACVRGCKDAVPVDG